MVEYKKYIIRILFFLLFIVAIAFSFKERLLQGFSHNQELNSAIILIFIVGVILVLKNIILISKEQTWLYAFMTGKNTTTNYSPTLLKKLKELVNNKNVNEGNFISQNLVQENLERVAVKLDSDREMIKYITALLVFLGLLGTFWGLLITIETVGQTISNMSIDEENILTNFANLKESLKAPLAGMGIAFSSSLFGLTSSLLLGFIDLQGNRAQNTFLDNLESVNLNSNAQVQSSVDNVGLEYVEALLHQTVSAINNLEKSLTKNEELRKNYDNLIIESSNAISKINNEINIRVNQYNKNEIANIENLRNIDENLNKLKEEINTSKNQASEEITKEIQLLAKTISLIKK
ncbi:MotA/TolQ/ExbB proton channel family protein [Alphaproteobacteria bacterium]|nr:MotA/TolQ/ExbB proton channel family protein [Alphaproteobacteria bacterium]